MQGGLIEPFDSEYRRAVALMGKVGNLEPSSPPAGVEAASQPNFI
jgi:hypothetical protein